MPSLRLGDVIFEIQVCVFLENDKTDLRQIFSGFKRKHFFITTCIKKHCIRPLMSITMLLLFKILLYNWLIATSF